MIKLKEYQELALIGISKGGGLTYDDLLELGFSKRMIKDYTQKGLLSKPKQETVTIDGKDMTRTWFGIGKQGRKEMQQRGYCISFQKGQSYLHCPTTAREVIKKVRAGIHPSKILCEEEIKKEWRKEYDNAKKQGIKISTPDIVILEEIITEEGITIEQVSVIETVTENYSKSEIREKIEFIEKVIQTRANCKIKTVELVEASY